MNGKLSLAALSFALLFMLAGVALLVPVVLVSFGKCQNVPAFSVGLGVFLLVLAFVVAVPARAQEAIAEAKVLIPFNRGP